MGTYKPRERHEARQLRREEGMAIKRIARKLGVSPSSVLIWTADVELTGEQRQENQRRERANRESFGSRAESWSRTARDRRRGWQREGRARARLGDPLHEAGCMLYWAEGTKSRNQLAFSNSDQNMLRFFGKFLRESLGVDPKDFRLRLNVYTNNGLSLVEIEDHWLIALAAPRSCLRGHSLNAYPTSTSGQRRRLPFGVCALRVARSTRLVQHIFGAIQEYARFEEPRWLDGPPRKRRQKKTETATEPVSKAA
jgi:hypothetical protein